MKTQNRTVERMKSVRKPMPPATRIIQHKKKYNRRDKSWLNGE